MTLTQTVKIKISLPDEGIEIITDALRGPNAASPVIDVDAAEELVDAWRAKMGITRAWIHAEDAIIGSDTPGNSAPWLWSWRALPDGLFALSDSPWWGEKQFEDKRMVVREYVQLITDDEAFTEIVKALTDTTATDLAAVLDHIIKAVTATGRPV